jgi:hypothetical protein
VRRLLLIASLVSALTVSALGAGWAHAALVLNARIPFADTLDNPCTGSVISVTGEMHVLGHAVLKGTTHAGAELSIIGSGVDTAGNRYRVVLQGSAVLNANFPLVPDETVTSGVAEATVVATANLISQGRSPNLVSHAVMHVVGHFDTGNATGTVDFVKAQCRG